MLGAIKMAKHLALGPDDVIVTVATDGHEMYAASCDRYLARRQNHGRPDEALAAEIVGQHLIGAGTEHVLEATHARARSASSTSATSPGSSSRASRSPISIAAASQDFWRGLHGLVPQWDEMITAFNRDSGMAAAGVTDEETDVRMSTDSPGQALSGAARETLARDRGLREKVMSLEEAAQLVQ